MMHHMFSSSKANEHLTSKHFMEGYMFTLAITALY